MNKHCVYISVCMYIYMVPLVAQKSPLLHFLPVSSCVERICWYIKGIRMGSDKKKAGVNNKACCPVPLVIIDQVNGTVVIYSR
jgi:hypothetical protein